jgi:hypothetical protein
MLNAHAQLLFRSSIISLKQGAWPVNTALAAAAAELTVSFADVEVEEAENEAVVTDELRSAARASLKSNLYCCCILVISDGSPPAAAAAAATREKSVSSGGCATVVIGLLE